MLQSSNSSCLQVSSTNLPCFLFSVAVMTRAFPENSGKRKELVLLQNIACYLLLSCGLVYIISVSNIYIIFTKEKGIPISNSLNFSSLGKWSSPNFHELNFTWNKNCSSLIGGISPLTIHIRYLLNIYLVSNLICTGNTLCCKFSGNTVHWLFKTCSPEERSF